MDDTSACETSANPPNHRKIRGQSEKYFVGLKLRRDPTSSTSDLYDFNMSLFDNGDPEDFFVCA